MAVIGLGGGAARAEGAPRLKVFVSILPQATFVERVGGTHVEVGVLVGPGQNPHAFEPSPKQMARLADARLLFTIGWPFEKLLAEKALSVNPALRLVDTRAGVPLRRMTADEAAHDEHDGHDEHGKHDEKPGLPGRSPGPAAAKPGREEHAPAAGEPDPHVWMNPRNVKIMAATIAAALAEADPAHAADYARNCKDFQADLDRVDAKIAAALAPLKGRPMLVFHPAFGYFADAYGLRQMPVEIEGKEPSARQLADLIDKARAAGARVIFVQPQFSTKTAEAVARAIGGAVVPIDDLSPDYLANLEAIAGRIANAVSPRP